MGLCVPGLHGENRASEGANSRIDGAGVDAWLNHKYPWRSRRLVHANSKLTVVHVLGLSLAAGALAEWAAAVLTVATLLTGLWQIHTDRRQRLEVERRAQARTVAAWLTGHDLPSGRTWVAVSNASTEPVFQVVMTLIGIYGALPRSGREVDPVRWRFRSYLGVLPPGNFFVAIPWGGGGMHMHFAIEIGFTDAGSQHWVRLGTGELKRVNLPMVKYYKLPEPVGWEYARHTTIPDSVT